MTEAAERFQRYVDKLTDGDLLVLHRLVCSRAAHIYRARSGAVQSRNYQQAMTQGCGIRGCERKHYSLGLCRTHHSMLPFRSGMERAVSMMDEAHLAAQARRAKVVSDLQAQLDGAA